MIIYAETKRQFLDDVDQNRLERRLIDGFQRQTGSVPADRGVWADEYARFSSALRRAAALKPEEADPWLSLAVLLQKAERYDEARAVYDKLRAAHPDDARLTFNMAMLAIKRHDDREARDLLTAFLKQPGGGRRLQRTARRALEDIEQRVGKPKAGPAPGREGRP